MHFGTASGRAFRDHARRLLRGRGPPGSRATAIPESPLAFRVLRQARGRVRITVRDLEPMVGAAETEARVAES